MTDDYQDAMEADKVIEMLGDKTGNLLIEYGFDSVSIIADAEDDELLGISGIGKSTLKDIRECLKDEGVSEDESATTLSEVKPYDEEAEPAGEVSAETTPAVEAVVDEVKVSPSGKGSISVRSLFPSRMKLEAPSGRVYEWGASGAEVNVDAEDVGFVFSKNHNDRRACCGGAGERQYFEEA